MVGMGPVGVGGGLFSCWCIGHWKLAWLRWLRWPLGHHTCLMGRGCRGCHSCWLGITMVGCRALMGVVPIGMREHGGHHACGGPIVPHAGMLSIGHSALHCWSSGLFIVPCARIYYSGVSCPLNEGWWIVSPTWMRRGTVHMCLYWALPVGTQHYTVGMRAHSGLFVVPYANALGIVSSMQWVLSVA